MYLTEIELELSKITHPEELFGFDLSRVQAVKVFKKYKQFTHEDKYTDKDKKLAHDLFIQINNLWSKALYKFRAGTYGNTSTIPIGDDVIISSKDNDYEIIGSFDTGNLCNVYYDSHHVIKIAKSHNDNELLDREKTVLDIFKECGTDILTSTTPKLVESFDIRNVSKEKLRVNVLDYYKDYYPLSKIKEKYPDGLDPRHIIWIWKRLLMTLGFVHKENIVHGCINLDNILVNPINHSVMIIDWCYSVTSGSPLVLIDEKYTGYYTKDVFDKHNVTSSLDIYMVAKCIEDIINIDNCPKTMYNTIKSGLIVNKSMQYKDAWEMYDLISDLGSHLYGKSKFIELVM